MDSLLFTTAMLQCLKYVLGKLMLVKRTLLVVVTLIAFELLVTFCGFVYKRHIVGNYYLIGVDDENDLSLSFQLHDDTFIGRVPARVIKYGYNKHSL